MPLRLDIKKKWILSSERVKCVDYHQSEPWVLLGLYSGVVMIYNTETKALVREFRTTDNSEGYPIRCVKFVSRKNWVICGSDEKRLRVYNYNTQEKLLDVEAHDDYIRSIAVHPTLPYVLTSSDDFTIKLWDWEKNWKNTLVFEGHSHYVMEVQFNPKDPNTFASASLDKTIKVWSIASPNPNYTLEGHQGGVNSVDFYHGGDRPYIISGADDLTAKIWDYQNKSCIRTLTGHLGNVASARFHPELPIIVTLGEDGIIKIWHANTFRLEDSLDYDMDRGWHMAYLSNTNEMAFAFDEGTVVLQLGRDEPCVSLDQLGKAVWSKNNAAFTTTLRSAEGSVMEDVKDGVVLQFQQKELGQCEVFAQSLSHSPNGRFIAVCGDGEYIIYTALAWRNKSFGTALDFAWCSTDSNVYAVRETSRLIKTFDNFKEKAAITVEEDANMIFGGVLLGVRFENYLCFYDWQSLALVRLINVEATQVYWSPSGEFVVIVTDQGFFVLKYHAHILEEINVANIPLGGIDEAFELVLEIQEAIKSGTWVRDCFIYTTASMRIHYLMGGHSNIIAHTDKPLYLLGHREDRIYLVDRHMNFVSYYFPLSVIDYETCILKEQMAEADALLAAVPPNQHHRLALFLETQGHIEKALAVSTDVEHRFELALKLGKLEQAKKIAYEAGQDSKWRQLADGALKEEELALAEECLWNCRDYGTLLMLFVATRHTKGLQKLSQVTESEGKNNVSFMCHYLLHHGKECVDLLMKENKVPEAALFAKSYAPEELEKVVTVWQAEWDQAQ